MKKDVSVIIVNYKTEELLLSCLESLNDHRSYTREIVVVDNNSNDGSVASVQKLYPDVRLLALTENIGFGRANNLALAHCTADLFFLLNPDTQLLPGCLEAIIRYMEQHPQTGMAGTAIYDAHGALQATVEGEYPGSHYAGTLFDDLPGDIAWLLGASLVVRKEVMQRVQGFDPDYFLYGEDIDLSLRIRKAGWSLGFIPDARIIHLGGQSERSTPDAILFEKKFRGELLFYRKHYPPEVIQRIKRVRRLQALWRVASLWLLGLFSKEDEEQRTKRAKYSVVARLYR